MSDKFDAPIRMPRITVEPEWIDYNGHMNVAFYVLAFDKAGVDPFFNLLGIGEDYTAHGRGSCFTLNCNVTYLRELSVGDPIEISCQLLDHDTRLMHFFMLMRQVTGNFIAATAEQISIHIDMESRKGSPFPPVTLARLEQIHRAHGDLPRHPLIGRVPGIRRKRQ